MFVCFFSDHSSGGLPAGVLSYELLGVVIVKYNFLHVNRVLFKSLFLNKMALYQKNVLVIAGDGYCFIFIYDVTNLVKMS